jgi:hypothetical protein
MTAEPFTAFEKVVDRDVYEPVPGNWFVGLTDLVDSSKAIADGRYKAVNTTGVAIIAAIRNALPKASTPFAFGGDGAAFAVPPEHAEVARRELARTARWAEDAFGLAMRAALVPVRDLREAGHDLLLGWYAVSDSALYAVFSGGGLDYAEQQMKAGNYGVAPAAPGEAPDLVGLSCRWQPIPSRKGVILSMIVRPAHNADRDYSGFVQQLIALIADERGGHPVPESGPGFSWPPAGLDHEARAMRGGPLFVRKIKAGAASLVGWFFLRTGLKAGEFDPARYMHYVTVNSDFRKFDDGLRMTVDCSEEMATEIEKRIESARLAGIVKAGTHRQGEALMTCYAPSINDDGHFHFLDGAGGGYAEAARKMKQATEAA